MAPFRKERMASLVREVVSEMIAQKLHDPRISAMTTVTRVELSPDLQVAKVYLSVQGELRAERRTVEAVQHAAGFIQRRLARELNVRSCPELRFAIDEQLKGARRMLKLIEENKPRDPEAVNTADLEDEVDLADDAPDDGDLIDEKEGRE